MKSVNLKDIIIRYILLLLLSIGNLYLIYKIFTPLTIYPVIGLLNLFYESYLIKETATIYFNGVYVEIIAACIGGAAYYLLAILNFSTPMDIKKRVSSILFLTSSFLILNIIRIVIFAVLFSSGFRYFDLTHKLIWYGGSTLMVVVLWFVNILIFRIKEIPIYSDFHRIIKNIKRNKKSKKAKN